MYQSPVVYYITKLDIDSSPVIADVIATITQVSRDHSIDCREWNGDTTNVPHGSLIVSIGGDGTMLHAMRESVKSYGISVIGVNLGRLGFLADTHRDDIAVMLANAITGQNIEVESRHLLSMQGTDILAVNEFLVTGKDFSTFFDCSVYVDGKRMMSFGGSGVTISTPTGSTAYALGQGGNILMPNIDAFLIAPFVPHTLTARPVIVSGDSIIEVRSTLTTRSPVVNILADGHAIDIKNSAIGTEHRFLFSKNPVDAKVIHANDWNFFDVLSEKMKW